MTEDTNGPQIRELAERLQALIDEVAARHDDLRRQREAQPYSTAELANDATTLFQWWRCEYGKIVEEAAAVGVSLADLMRTVSS
jgi:hypothetical protein